MTGRVGPDSVNDTPLIETDRLALSFGTEADVGVLFPHVHGDAGRAVTDMLLWDGPRQADELREYFRLHADGMFGEHGFNWNLRDRTGALTGTAGQAIGAIGLRPGPDAGTGDIGYWLAPAYWGLGLAGEAILAVTDHAFSHLGLGALVAEVFPHNERGLRLVEKLGFVTEGVRRRAVVKRGVTCDLVRYRLVRQR